MNGREYFHESVVRDIVDLLTSLKDFDEVQFINNANANRSFKSITSATKDLILTFPVMVSTDIDPENAIMIAKAHEKKCASLLHILFTAISVNNSEDVYDYVRKFHSNMGSMNGTLDSYADSLDKLSATFGESYEQTLKIDKAVLDTVLEELRESNYTLPDNVNESSLESYKIVPGYRTGMNDMIIKEEYSIFNEGRGKRKGKKNYPQNNNSTTTVTKQGYINQNIHSGSVDYNHNHKYSGNASVTHINSKDMNAEQELKDAATVATADPNSKEYKEAKARLDQLDKMRAPRETINRQIKGSPDFNQKNYLQNAEYLKNINDAHNKAILNNEYKKANELQPTMMVVNFIKHSEDNGDFINTAIIGIKAKIYPVSSSDICSRISGKLDDKNVLTNFVRATTNEIAFFRDFLFAIDNAKMDAKSYGKQASSNKMWKVLERRSTKSKFRRALKMYNDATAITTLVLSENDAEYLKKVYSIDIFNVDRARKILDAYNFMCICIANQSTEVASFLYDTGDDTYEMVPFSGLEREASDNSYKKMVNLLAKVSR